VLDHIGFDVKSHAAFVKKIEAEGIQLDEPVRKTPNGNTITYITDAWGTRIEIIHLRAERDRPRSPACRCSPRFGFGAHLGRFFVASSGASFSSARAPLRMSARP
jgi:hypothetical protein